LLTKPAGALNTPPCFGRSRMMRTVSVVSVADAIAEEDIAMAELLEQEEAFRHGMSVEELRLLIEDLQEDNIEGD